MFTEISKHTTKSILTICLVVAGLSKGYGQDSPVSARIAVEWQDEKPAGHIEVIQGNLEKLLIRKGKGKTGDNHFAFTSTGTNRLELELGQVRVNPGSRATVVTIRTGSNSFSFFLRDVNSENPIIIPQYHVVVCPAGDNRSYTEVESEIKKRRLQSEIEKINREPEESFDSAALYTRNQLCPTWLGLSRDTRIFEIGLAQEMNVIIPRMASSPMNLAESGSHEATYCYLAGRGQSVEPNAKRRLEDGVLPILNADWKDGDIRYATTSFVTLESSPLNGKTLEGTHYLVADSFSYGHMFTPAHKNLLAALIDEELNRKEETVLYYRAVATNTGSVPRYAWFRTLRPGRGWWEKYSQVYDKETGFSSYSADRIFGISRLNGMPLPDEEAAILLKPGEKAVFEFMLPHQPIPPARARELSVQSFAERYAECKFFWQEKLYHAARIKIPEKRIDEMIRAGLLHLDLIAYGKEPAGTLAPCVGVYSPIGTESSPIIQFFSSMGLHETARRSLMYFLDKQHDDGMIQNFGGYMVETGAALWSMGEYFRYTNDTAWVRQVKSKLLKACDFLINWREKNKKESLRGKGYGMIDGKVADPEDQYHQYMLNGYAYLGISRVAEMLYPVDPANSLRLRKEADSWKQDIRTSLVNSLAISPVVPLGDGSWCPTVPPWTEARALRLLYPEGETFLSHGTFMVSDAMLGPLYLVFCEVLDPLEPASQMLMNYHSEMFLQRNAAFSQPYYSRHNWVQLKQGMVKPFLKTYYNTFSALADRETYTFWEHLYKVSVHKTHEEAWFLMETRWMLYLEEGRMLRLLPGIPRKWLENGNRIELGDVASYFGSLSLIVNSNLNNGYIDASITCDSDRKPLEVRIRIPHPGGKKPVKVTGGIYDGTTETVVIKPFSGNGYIRLDY